ncbi:hypothetical protein C3729_10520 [Cloacibacterium normanense]|jgi:hypothetical protein|uniref:Lipoprotein n=1 Tax=Cloacibacterium normanense TaxID=237258 RepID=A0A2S7I2P4_9FLAO|nr:DUF6452 family protein [Cloacibacterium normanense]PPZ90848.1 hypothetical protein C3729_10520 [Cloacibacterium normanense]
MKKLIFPFLILGFLLTSCENDDDVCVSGEATPRLKIKFKSADNKVLTLESLYLDVDYGNNNILTVVEATKIDSVLVPIRVDDAGFTELYVRKTKNGKVSKIKLNYNTTSEYVSPACGFKRLYQNLSGTLETANPVTKVELNQNQIINENKAHLYLVF